MPDKTMTNANIDDILSNAGVKMTDAAPAKIETPTPKTEDGYKGAYRAPDGRMLHQYILDGQKVILPKLLEEMTEDDFYQLGPSLYDSGVNRLPQNLTVKFLDPQWAGHWFNRKASDGRSVSRAMSLGYLPAKKEDCEWVAHSLNDDDGAITDGDLVLMKISKAKMFFQLKTWVDEAKIKQGKNPQTNQFSYQATAEGALFGNPGGKVAYYPTPQAEREFQGLGPVVSMNTA
jgi:hypothetical protein